LIPKETLRIILPVSNGPAGYQGGGERYGPDFPLSC
jgi:hypothetical protein